jgi:hypothetical protein
MAAGSTGAKEVRAVGSTRAYSFKPETSTRGRYGSTVVKNERIRDESGRSKLDKDVSAAFSAAESRAQSNKIIIGRQFDSRIKEERSKWWNPMAQMKANKIAKMKDRSMKALDATTSYRTSNYAMLEMRNLGYRVTARRNRRLV